jgi:hypothetical protein
MCERGLVEGQFVGEVGFEIQLLRYLIVENGIYYFDMHRLN